MALWVGPRSESKSSLSVTIAEQIGSDDGMASFRGLHRCQDGVDLKNKTEQPIERTDGNACGTTFTPIRPI